MYIITTGLSPNDDYICHYGRKGMKWGEHIYSRDDIKRLKKFMRTKDAKEYQKAFKKWEKNRYAKLGYKKGLLYDTVKKGSKLSRYTSAENEKVKGRTYVSMDNSPDDANYEQGALLGALGEKDKTKDQYKDVYTVEKKLIVARGKKVANDIVKKYGDKDLKEMWAMYKDLDVHNKTSYIYEMNSGIGENATREKVDSANDMILLKTEVAQRMNKLLYENENVKTYIDNKYRKLGYDAIEDAEDQMHGASHPMIVYDPEKKIRKESSTNISQEYYDLLGIENPNKKRKKK